MVLDMSFIVLADAPIEELSEYRNSFMCLSAAGLKLTEYFSRHQQRIWKSSSGVKSLNTKV